MTRGPSIAMVWEGPSAVLLTKKMKDSMVHLAKTTEDAHEEISLWFTEEELVNYKLATAHWIL